MNVSVQSPSISSAQVVTKNGAKTVLSLLIYALLIVNTNQAKDSSTCHLREVELCVIGAASIFSSPNGIPVSGREFERHCEYMKESCDCFNDYNNRCLTEQQNGIVNMFTGDMSRLEKELCTNGSDMGEAYLKHAPCLREVQKKYQRPCMRDYQVGFEAIHKTGVSDRFPTACCNTKRLEQCILPQIEDACGQEALDLVNLFISRMFGRVFTVTCRNYDPSGDACKSLLPEPGTEPHNGRNTSSISRIISSYVRI